MKKGIGYRLAPLFLISALVSVVLCCINISTMDSYSSLSVILFLVSCFVEIITTVIIFTMLCDVRYIFENMKTKDCFSK